MNIRLSDHFTYKKLLRFTLPSIVMMIFTSIYGVVDGFFVSNFVGKTPFAAVNFIMPFIMMLGAVGFMFGTGGSALISKTMGEGDCDKANRLFSLFVYVSFFCGIVIAVLGIAFLRPISVLLGAKGLMLEQCVLYGRIVLAAIPAFLLQMEFQSFFVTAEKPQLGLSITIVAGVVNMVLDALFVAVFDMGLVGAALATALSQAAGGIIPFFYFLRPNGSLLRLTRTSFDGASLLKACGNGSSELMSNISASVVSMIYNFQLMKYVGENGVSSYGVLMYVQFIFIAIYIGYSIGAAPIISYHYGARNYGELKNMLKKSVTLTGVASIVLTASAYCPASPLSKIFVGYDAGLYALTYHAFRLFAFSFLLAGFNIFTSSFFTALNNGGISAAISFMRTLLFQTASVLILPLLLGVDGIWWAITVAEVFACILSASFLLAKRGTYHYL